MDEQEFSLVLSIVIPAYKERENLAVFIPQVEKAFPDAPFEIIVVDDNSKDGTRELVEDMNSRYGNIYLVERVGVLGIGSALRAGYNVAQGEYILSSDADLSFSAEEMRALYKKIQQGYDVVLGYKVALPAAAARVKYRASHLCNWIIRQISGLGSFKDFNTNFRILRASFWRQLDTREHSHFFLFETIFKAKRKGARIGEMPVTFYDRKFGETKLNFFKEAPQYFLKLIRYTFFVK